MELIDRVRASLLGCAIGDALGHPTEFIASVAAIRERFGPGGVTGFVRTGKHPAGTFTDDTQMALCVARALCRAGHAGLDALMSVMGAEFVAWSRSPQNNRAPGGTCLAGCRNLARGAPWREAGVKGSKGCGAAMRASPVGLFHHDDTAVMVEVSAAQSALTHTHPTGVASSVAAAAAVAWFARGEAIEGLLPFTRGCVESLTTEQLVGVGCDLRMVERIGTREMLTALDRVIEMAERESDDVCALLGGAWVGEEAVACALWCVLRAKGDFRESVLRGANSSGDSDSIACIAGSITGARDGIDAMPSEWVRDLEKSSLIDALARNLYTAMASGKDLALDLTLDLFGAERLAVRPEDEWGEDDTDVQPMPDLVRSLRKTPPPFAKE